MREAPTAWELDGDVLARIAALEAELAELYESLLPTAPDGETADALDRLVLGARGRSDLFRIVAADAGSSPHDLLGEWLEAETRFEAAAAEAAAEHPSLARFHEDVAALGREVDALLLATGGGVDG